MSVHLLSASWLTVTFLASTSVTDLKRNIRHSLKSVTTASMPMAKEHKEKSAEQPKLQHHHKFYFRRGKVTNTFHCKIDFLPTAISSQLQRKTLAKTRRGEGRGIGKTTVPRHAESPFSCSE